MLADGAAAFNVVAAGAALILRVTLKPLDRVGAGADALEALLLGVIVGELDELGGQTLTG